MSSASQRDQVEQRLRDAGHRVTAAKRALVEVLLSQHGHRTADQLIEAVQESQPDVATSTVYRILEEFDELGIVVHSHLARQAAVYHLADVTHAHLLCSVCHHDYQVPSALFDDLSAALLAHEGFALDRHHVALSGVCAACRAATS